MAPAFRRKIQGPSTWICGLLHDYWVVAEISPHDLRAARLRAARSARRGRRRRPRGAMGAASHATTSRWSMRSLALGLEFLPPPAERLWSLNAVKVPAGVDEAAIRKSLLQDFSIEIGAGLGPLAGKIWRVGLMGSGSTPENVIAARRRARHAAASMTRKTRAGAGCVPSGRGLAVLLADRVLPPPRTCICRFPMCVACGRRIPPRPRSWSCARARRTRKGSPRCANSAGCRTRASPHT